MIVNWIIKLEFTLIIYSIIKLSWWITEHNVLNQYSEWHQHRKIIGPCGQLNKSSFDG